MAQLDAKGLMKACQALNARISSRDWPGATREIIAIYLDEAERSKAPDEAIERACIAYWGEQTFFRIFGEKSRRNIREAMRRAATEFASDAQEVADDLEARPDDLASQLRWFSEKKKWPKGLEGMPELLAKAAAAILAAPTLPSPAQEANAKQSERIERLAEYLCSEFDFSLNPCVGYSWPEHENDDGYRGDGSSVKLQPADVQAYARENAARILAFLEREAALSAQAQDEPGRKPLDLNITKEWFEKRAALEGDHEIGAGRRKLTASIDPTPEELAELHRLAHRIPEGWQLVPIEPTQEMCEAAPSLPAIDAIDDLPLKKSGWSMSAIVNRKRYLAMLAAASAKREG